MVEATARDLLEFDVVIVGAGPAGLAAACRLRQLNRDISVCVLEKASEVGGHILSGAIMQPTAMAELFPDWRERGAPLHVPVTEDEVYFLPSERRAIRLPKIMEPKTLRNGGNYIVSLGNVCRWLAQQAEQLGVDIYPGFAAAEVLYDEGRVVGVITGDLGLDQSGQPKEGYMPGMELRAKYTLFAEGCRGHLGKQLIERFDLQRGKDPQHYALGIKELWEIEPERHHQGRVLHSAGWPAAASGASGGGFLYHLDNNLVSLGYISDLSYRNPHYSPFDEMQRWKLNPAIRRYLEGGKRVSYGARAIAKGGLQSLPKMTFAGGMLLGCDAGTLNNAKIKGSHTAMKSGMLAAETLVEALQQGRVGEDLLDYQQRFDRSWIYTELHQQRNWGPARHKWGDLLGGAFAFIDLNLLGGRMPVTLRDASEDHAQLQAAAQCPRMDYPKPDGMLTFGKLESVFLSNTNHAEDQPCHLRLTDTRLPVAHNLPLYDEPAQRYCPAGVYEIIETDAGEAQLQINAQNCLHCKTCDIKDPRQNIQWCPPEGGGGPNYPNM